MANRTQHAADNPIGSRKKAIGNAAGSDVSLTRVMPQFLASFASSIEPGTFRIFDEAQACGALRIKELSPTEWLIIDADPAVMPPDSYRGFIQLIENRYEVTMLGSRVEYHATDTVEEALAYVSR